MKKALPQSIPDTNNVKPYGSLISIGNERKHFTINDGYCERFDELSEIDVIDNLSKPIVSIFSASPRPKPVAINYLEMHPLGSQTFLPIQNIDWSVIVATDRNGTPDLSSIKCFKIKGTQGFSYKPYVWHFPLLTEKSQDFWVIDRSSKNDKSNVNLREYYFSEENQKFYLE